MPRSLPAAAALAVLAAALGQVSPPSAALAQDLVVSDQLERAAFRAADRNGDGVIDEAELAADATAAFLTLDRNGDGVLERDELVGADTRAFARVDSDGDGRITYDELRLAKLAAFNTADRTQNGQLTMAELLERRGGAQ